MGQSIMYNFVKRMWTSNRCDEAYVLVQLEYNRLRQDEVDEILSIEQK